MDEWLVVIGAAAMVVGAALMFSDLMELRAKRGDAGEVALLLQKGVIGNRWIRLAVQVLTTGGLITISVGLTVGG